MRTLALAGLLLASAEPVNHDCPMDGKPVDRGRTSEVKIEFCCANCKGRFDRDPFAWLSKVYKLPNERCPLSGKPPADAVSTLTIGFCSGDCKKAFDQEPARHLGKVRAPAKEGR